MYEYLISGRDAEGYAVTEIVEATSGDDAVRGFEDRGFTDIVLHTNETAALLYKPSSAAALFQPHEMLAIRELRAGPVTARVALKLYRKLWYLVAIPAAIALGWLLYDGELVLWGTVAVVAALVPGLLALYVGYGGTATIYRRLLIAIGWGRWEEALRLVPRVKMKLPEFELPFREAQALAGLGQMAEALRVYDRLDGNPTIPRPVFWGFLGLVYVAGGEKEKAVMALERAHELAPDNPDILIDLASVLVSFRQDVVRAKQLLTRARTHVLADITEPFYRATQGLIALAEGRPAEAAEHLEWGVRRLQPLLRANPSVLYYVARIQSYLALAHAEAGNVEAARREADVCRPVLESHRDEQMLARLLAAVG